VLVDVRRHVRLGVGSQDAAVEVPTPPPAPGTAFGPRRLWLRGRPVFELSLWCGTCPALFRRIAEPRTADVDVANAILASGLTGIDEAVLAAYGRLLPRSEYTVLLLEVGPRLVEPGSEGDYFAGEQVRTWGVNPVTGAPEDPGGAYYRTFEAPVDSGRHLYEVIVPMVPPSWNGPDQAARQQQGSEALPTAVAYSVLDVSQPAMRGGEDYYEHWLLSHFLLDGHHKVAAAAGAGRTVRLLCLVDERISVARWGDLDVLIRTRRGTGASRVPQPPSRPLR
jgi:hypothetical protein